MLCSKWKAAAVSASLACAGFGWAGLVFSQQSAGRPSASGSATGETITINEAGKPPQQCVIQKTTRLADGKLAYEIRNTATGEVTTLYTDAGADAIVKPSTAQGAKSKATNSPAVFGQEKTTLAPSQAGPKVQPAATVNPWTPVSSSAARFRTIDEPGKAPLKCRVVAEWHTPEGHRAGQLQALDSGEFLTIVEVGPVQGSSSASSAMNKVTAKLYHWGSSKTPPPGVPLPPAAPVIVEGASQPWTGTAKSGKVVMPANMATTWVEAPKASLGAKILDSVGSLFSGRTTAPAPVIYMPAQGTMSKAANTAKVINAPAKVDIATQTEKTKIVSEPPPTTETAKAADKAKGATQPVKTAEAAKLQETPTLADTVAANATTKVPELPAPPAATEKLELPMLPEAPKPATAGTPGPPSLVPNGQPAAPLMDYKDQWAPSAAKSPGAGKPSADNTLPASSYPVVPSPPSAQGTSALPSLPPAASMPFSASKKNDPLSNPESFLPARSDGSKLPPANGVLKAPGSASATDMSRVPLGAASVVAAANGGDPRFLPVPMVTVPQAKPPMPPGSAMPSLPSLPQAAAAASDQSMFVNAFSPPMTPEAQQQAAAIAQMQQRQMMPAMPPGYPMGPALPGMAAPNYPGMPMPGQVPMGYQGPMPPNPGTGMQGYSMPMQPATQGFANPAMDRPGVPAGGAAAAPQAINTLQSSIFPTQREQAVMQLTMGESRTNPQVIALLLKTAKDDPAPMVRAACISGLVSMGVATEAAVATYHQLKTDVDPRVRQEAEQALARTATTRAVQPVGVVDR